MNKILLVEDDLIHARIMRRAFEEPPHQDQIVHMTDGESALAVLIRDETENEISPAADSSDASSRSATGESVGKRAHSRSQGDEDNSLPSLILLDLRLPTVDGFEVLQAIRSNRRTRNIPVIIVSTSERPGDIRHCYDLGANAYITKPVDYNTFLEKLRALREFWLSSAELPLGNE